MDHISIRMEEGLAPDDVLPPKFDLVVSIRENLLKAKKAEMPWDAWGKVCIYRVPKALRDVNPHAFDPQIVSIGPYHRGKEGLRDMDIHKWRCFHRIIRRSKLDEMFLFNSIRKDVSEARRCYEGTIELSDDEFVETMVLDGCFLLEIFRGCLDDGFRWLGYSPYDPVFRRDKALDFIGPDVKRLENQVPLFILGRLLGRITNEMEDQKDQVIELALNYFEVKKPIEKYRNCVHCLDIYWRSLLDYEPIPQQTSSKFKKLLHLITSPCYRNTSNLDPPNNPPTGQVTIPCVTKHSPPTKQLTVPCVTKLSEAGITFKKRETKEEHGDMQDQEVAWGYARPSFFDIKFEAGVLHIPMLLLDDNSRREFPNLIAFEQCHLGCSNHVTSYAAFMDDLIDSSDDVAYLHDCGIIDPSGGGSYKETAKFFNSTGSEVVFHPSASYLSGVTSDLMKEVTWYNESKIRHWTVNIKRMYFSYPWSIISLLAAIFLLILTFLATFYAMYGYYKPRSLIAWLM